MAQYKMHVVGGICCYYLMLFGSGLYPTAALAQRGELLLCTLVGSLFPDVDIKSKGQQLVYGLLVFILLLLLLVQRYTIAAWLGTVAILPLVAKHRGIWHELWFLLLMVIGIATQLTRCFPGSCSRIFMDALFFSGGIVSHLLLDGYGRRLLRWR